MFRKHDLYSKVEENSKAFRTFEPNTTRSFMSNFKLPFDANKKSFLQSGSLQIEVDQGPLEDFTSKGQALRTIKRNSVDHARVTARLKFKSPKEI